jgi:hypothetical protein
MIVTMVFSIFALLAARGILLGIAISTLTSKVALDQLSSLWLVLLPSFGSSLLLILPRPTYRQFPHRFFLFRSWRLLISAFSLKLMDREDEGQYLQRARLSAVQIRGGQVPSRH